MQTPRLERGAAHVGEHPAGGALPHRKHRRNLLHAGRPPSVESRAHAERRRVPGAHAPLRPHRAARRFRPRGGGHAARALACSGNGRDHHALFSRQARHAHAGSRGRHPRARFRPRAEPWAAGRISRARAGAIGIRKVASARELWEIVHALGDEQSRYVLERFVPGDIFHVDSIVYERQVRFAIASGYGKPPLEVAHAGGIFTTRILERESETARRLLAENQHVLAELGLLRGVSHTEYIIGRDDGHVYFLETSARVGGAHIADLVEAATGINLWAEWAKVELAGGHVP